MAENLPITNTAGRVTAPRDAATVRGVLAGAVKDLRSRAIPREVAVSDWLARVHNGLPDHGVVAPSRELDEAYTLARFAVDDAVREAAILDEMLTNFHAKGTVH